MTSRSLSAIRHIKTSHVIDSIKNLDVTNDITIETPLQKKPINIETTYTIPTVELQTNEITSANQLTLPSETSKIFDKTSSKIPFFFDGTTESEIVQSFEQKLASDNDNLDSTPILHQNKRQKTIQLSDTTQNDEEYHELLTSNLEEVLKKKSESTISEIVPWKTICTKHSSFLKKEEKSFELGKKLGEGAFGIVWSLKSSYSKCIKLVRAKTKTKQKLLNIHSEMLSNERHYKVCTSPFIVTLYEYGTIHSLELAKDATKIYAAYAIMEKCAGGDMFEPLFNGEYETFDQINTTAYNLISALCALEQAGIVHCDLKPQNISIADPDDITSVRLIDFGGSVESNTKTHIMTYAYASPEQLTLDTRIVNTKSDVYTMGLILAQMLVYGVDSDPNAAAQSDWFFHADDVPRSIKARTIWANSVQSSSVSTVLSGMLEINLAKRKLASQLINTDFITLYAFEKLTHFPRKFF